MFHITIVIVCEGTLDLFTCQFVLKPTFYAVFTQLVALVTVSLSRVCSLGTKSMQRGNLGTFESRHLFKRMNFCVFLYMIMYYADDGACTCVNAVFDQDHLAHALSFHGDGIH